MLYTVYFEIYGKKLKTKVSAKSQDDAKQLIRNQIIFHKIEAKIEEDKAVRDLMDMLGMR